MPTTPFYPGVYIEEVPSQSKTIIGVSTSITAFVGIAKKGPTNEPTLIHNYSDYERIFGGIWKYSHMSYSVFHYFQNGGREAIITRVIDKAKPAKFENRDERLKFYASSPGTWAKNLSIKTDYQELTGNEFFNLTVFLRNGAEEESLETHKKLSHDQNNIRYATNIINEESNTIIIDKDLNFTRPTDQTVFTYQLNTAVDDHQITKKMILGNLDEKTGIYALEKTDLFNIMCIPTFTLSRNDLQEIYSEAAKYCKTRRAMLIVDPPNTWKNHRDPTGNEKYNLPESNAATYFPQIIAYDSERETTNTFAPSGAIAGVYSRTDGTRGVWKAPAGIEATINGIRKLAVNLTDDENGKLNFKGINCLRTLRDIGSVVWGARTMRGDDILVDQWKYIPVRRTALYIEESLYRGLQWVVFEPNDEKLWSQIRLNVKTFMHDLFRRGAFQGTSPKQAYLVKCDTETTTQRDIDKGIVNIVIGFAPLKPAEFIILYIQQLAGQKAV